jgi:GNAT superfamily N-acetyltransferase
MPSDRFTIRPAGVADVAGAIGALGEAFAQDPLTAYFFRGSPNDIRAEVAAFFSILLRVRIALGMPAFVLQHAGGIQGAAMGYDTSRPGWPEPLAEEWRQFEADLPGLIDRFAAYDRIAEAHRPGDAHHYLGVLGVHPSMQGKGAGKALLEVFCASSLADPKSHGVYLETASPSSLQFYYRNGFELRGEGDLDGLPLWCLYRPT